MLAPIVMFVYKRLDHTRQTLKALQQCRGAEESELIVYSDGAKGEYDATAVQAVRDFLSTVDGFYSVQIHHRPVNIGLAQNIIDGISTVIKKYHKVIVLEDDLICAPGFLQFMNQALIKKQDDLKIFSISGFNPPMYKPIDYPHDVYLNYRNSSWGWATWSNRWDKVDWAITDQNQFFRDRTAKKLFERGGEDLSLMLWKQMQGQLDSWAIRFCYAQFKYQAFSLCPLQSLVENIGCDGSGVHSDKTNKFSVTINNSNEVVQIPESLIVNETLMKEFRKYYRLPFMKKVKKKILMDLLHG